MRIFSVELKSLLAHDVICVNRYKIYDPVEQSPLRLDIRSLQICAGVAPESTAMIPKDGSSGSESEGLSLRKNYGFEVGIVLEVGARRPK